MSEPVLEGLLLKLFRTPERGLVFFISLRLPSAILDDLHLGKSRRSNQQPSCFAGALFGHVPLEPFDGFTIALPPVERQEVDIALEHRQLIPPVQRFEDC